MGYIPFGVKRLRKEPELPPLPELPSSRASSRASTPFLGSSQTLVPPGGGSRGPTPLRSSATVMEPQLPVYQGGVQRIDFLPKDEVMDEGAGKVEEAEDQGSSGDGSDGHQTDGKATGGGDGKAVEKAE